LIKRYVVSVVLLAWGLQAGSAGAASPDVASSEGAVPNGSLSLHDDLEPYAYVEEREVLDFLSERHGISVEGARAAAAFEQGPAMRLGDVLHREFGDRILRIEVDPAVQESIVYVSGEGEQVSQFVRSQEDVGSVTVLDGYLPIADVGREWELLQSQLEAKGLPVSAALRPNEIVVFVNDETLASEILEAMDRAPGIRISFERGGAYEAMVDVRGGWADVFNYGSGGQRTLGFAASYNGKWGMVTAGHCADYLTTRKLATDPDWISTSSCREFFRTVQYYNSAVHPQVDFQFQRDSPGPNGACLDTFQDDVCSGGTLRTTPTPYVECTAYIDIAAWSWTNSVGLSVRSFGSRGSGVNVAVILDNTFDPGCTNCSADYVLIEATSADYTPGDSGGPVRNGSTLQGILHSRNLDDFSQATYTKVGWIQAIGPKPLTAGGAGNSD
jgi:hypothetical protein